MTSDCFMIRFAISLYLPSLATAVAKFMRTAGRAASSNTSKDQDTAGQRFVLGLYQSDDDSWSQETELAAEQSHRSGLVDAIDLMGDYEALVAKKIKMTSQTYFIPTRFPIPKIPVYVEDSRRGCILGVDSCRALHEGQAWWPDPHVRDIISSALLPCKFQRTPCLAMDIGANFGYHAMTMLQFNTKVITVEPQADMCASLMASVLHSHLGKYANIYCGAIATARSIDTNRKFRHFLPSRHEHYGSPAVFFNHTDYGMDDLVPMIRLEDILPPVGSTVELLKIDTDSIDCDVFQQALALIGGKRLHVRNIVMESTGCLFLPFSKALWEAQNFNFTIYRTLLWEKHFKNDGSFPEAQNYTVPDNVDEVMDIRFNRYLWRFRKNLSLPQVQDLVKVSKLGWQFFLSQDVLHSNPLQIFEKT
mmetsp:Transcript_42/g.75  ORF Transcript_42/g.75 Transcript_42/m.75 type:complete len:419 (-) Transcript_42:7-1263(-)